MKQILSMIININLLKKTFFWKYLSPKRKRYFQLLLGSLLVILIPLAVIWIQKPPTAKAAWLDENWLYRKSIAISTHTSSENNIYINLTGGSALDTSSTTKFQGDCGDLRFTKQNGEILPYYISSGCGTATTVIHVQFDNFPSGAQTIYYYYGNPSVANGFSSADFSTEASSYTLGSLGSEEQSPGPVGYWKFDDGQGQTTQDATTTNNDGTLGADSNSGSDDPTWTTEDQCVVGKCLMFASASSQYVGLGTNDSLNLSSALTISAWIKTPTNPSVYQTIYAHSRGNGDWTGYELAVHTSNTLRFTSENTAGSAASIDVIGSTNVTDNKWHYVVVTFDGTTAKFYIDGVQDPTTGTGTITASPSGKNSYIARRATSAYFNGFIDDVKVYSFARSAAQVKADFLAGSGVATKQGSSSTLGTKTQEYLSEGLVGYFKMDEASGNLTDSSGNSGTGTVTGTTVAAGKFGNGRDFNGSTDKATVTDAASNRFGSGSFTFATWIKPDALGAGTFDDDPKRLIEKNGYPTKWWNIDINSSGQVEMEMGDDSSQIGTTTSSSGSLVLTTGTWQHLVIVVDRTSGKTYYYFNGALGASPNIPAAFTGTLNVTGANMIIGGNWKPYDGIMDEIRVYNRALSPKEVSDLYNFAPGPVGYWNFDERTGTTANDISGNGLNGTLGNGTADYRPKWAAGKIGGGLKFDGTDDNVLVTDNAILDPSIGMSLSSWIKLNTLPSAAGHYFDIVDKWTGTGDQRSYEWFVQTDDKVYFIATVNGLLATQSTVSSNNALTTNRWYHVEVAYDGTTIRLYIDGILQTSTATISSIYPSTTNFSIGRDDTSTTTGQFNGWIDDLKLYSYGRTSKQIVEDMNAGHPAVGSPIGSPIGYWKLDEGYGTTAYNSGSSGSLDNGTFGCTGGGCTNPSWTLSGKFGKALTLNGSNNIAKSSSSILPTGALSISAWIKIGSTSTDYTITDRGDSNDVIPWAHFYYSGSNNNLVLWNFNGNSAASSNTISIEDNQWHYVAVAANTGDYPKLYVDGADVTPSSGNNTYSENTSATVSPYPFEIGGRTRIGSIIRGLVGSIDEVKIYNYVLTADEVRKDMNRGQAMLLGASTNDLAPTLTPPPVNSTAGEYCVPGDSVSCAPPVGEWKFDERMGNSVFDSSGNSFTGTWNGTGRHWTSGKDSPGGVFTGSTAGDYVAIGNINKTLGSLSMWFKPNTVINTSSGSLGALITFIDGEDHNADVWIHIGNGATSSCTNEIITIMDSLNGKRTCVTDITINSVWNHLELAWNSTNSRYDIYLNGVIQTVTSGTSTHVGQITISNLEIAYKEATPTYSDFYGNFTGDQIRIYDYARSASQVAWDYNRGKPTAHWKFDECQGTTTYDSSGNGYSGTITPGSGGQTAVGTCSGSAGTMWKDGATGKRNASLDFDGTDDYVSIGTSLNSHLIRSKPFSISAWIKTSGSTQQDIVTNADYDSPYVGIEFLVNTSGQLRFDLNQTATKLIRKTTSATVNDGNWHHVVITYSGSGAASGVTIYNNANSLSTTTNNDNTDGDVTSSTNLEIGARDATNAPFTGQIDDVKVYNYALTASQVKQVYNEHAIRFGPATGAP